MVCSCNRKIFIPIILITSFTLFLGYSTSYYYGIGEVGALNLIQNQTISLDVYKLDLLGAPQDTSNVFSVGDYIQVHVLVYSKTSGTVPVSLTVFKETEDADKIVSNVTQFVTLYSEPYYYDDMSNANINTNNASTNNASTNNASTNNASTNNASTNNASTNNASTNNASTNNASTNNAYSGDAYSGDAYFNLNGITDSGRYVIKATVMGTNNYAKVTAIFQDKTWHFINNDLLTFQNLKLMIAFISLVGMISFLIYQVIHWKPHQQIDKKTRELNDLIGFIIMTIMVFSIISYLSAVDTPIGVNTSFGIVSRSDLDPGDIISGNVPQEILKNVKREWVLNLGGSAQLLCINAKNGTVMYQQSVPDEKHDNNEMCSSLSLSYSYSGTYEQTQNHIIFNGGIQIPLYVPILGFIGAYLRYVYNITIKTIKIKKGKEKEGDLDSLKDFLHEFVLIILSPIAALALWLLLRQSGIISDLTLALSSITVGLALEPFIKRLEKWLPDKLEREEHEGEEHEGEEHEGEEHEGEEHEGEEHEGKKPEGKKPEGKKPEGKKPEGKKPEGK